MGDITIQNTHIKNAIFGIKVTEVGLTKFDKDINDRLKIYKAWGKDILRERVEQIEKKL